MSGKPPIKKATIVEQTPIDLDKFINLITYIGFKKDLTAVIASRYRLDEHEIRITKMDGSKLRESHYYAKITTDTSDVFYATSEEDIKERFKHIIRDKKIDNLL